MPGADTSEATAPPPSVMMSFDAREVSAAFDPRSNRVGTFTIVRTHAHGGLGLISLARDELLGREVALKQIRPQLADDARSRHRFINEAEITAQLEHPGIVPIHAMGHDNLGRPFYAMKFVHGRTLEAAVSEHHRAPGGKSLRDLLRRFVGICEAIAYAHSRGVIHRDLKPSNVMLGAFGETLILDWGLAKRFGDAAVSEDASDLPLAVSQLVTLDGQVVGTPLYMSPEQASGDVAKQGPASDIYALGAMLYHILTGKPALSGSSNDEIVTRLRAAQPVPKPSLVNRRVNRALEAICVKAMSPRIEDRYPSAEALAADVEHWMADEPVSAYREPLAARLARVSRRHKSVVLGGAAVILVLVIGIVATTLQVVRATRAEGRAEAEKQLAQKRFGEVRTLANKFMFDFDQQIENLSGSTPARQMLVQTSLEYLNKLAADARDDPDLLGELATAYEKVGNIQGNPNLGNNLGDTAGALESYHKALQIARRLQSAAPGKDPRQVPLLLSRIADLQEARGENSAALASYREVLAEFERAAAAGSTEPRLHRDRAVSNVRVGDMLHATGDRPGAMQHFEKGLEHARAYAAVSSDPRAQLEVIIPQMRIALQLLETGNAAAALPHYQDVIDKLERAAAAEPDNTRHRFSLEWTYLQLGSTQLAAGDGESAMRSYDRALRIARDLAADDPTNVRPLQDIEQVYLRITEAHLKAGRNDAAIAAARELMDTATAHATANPDSVFAQRIVGLAEQRVAQVLHRTGDSSGAMDQFTRSLATMQSAAARDPGSMLLQRDVWISHYNLGELHDELARDESRPLPQRIDHMTRSRDFYTGALSILQGMGEAGRSVQHTDTTAPDELRTAITRCDEWLASHAHPTTTTSPR
jgi:serine/threonine-protein kinase